LKIVAYMKMKLLAIHKLQSQKMHDHWTIHADFNPLWQIELQVKVGPVDPEFERMNRSAQPSFTSLPRYIHEALCNVNGKAG
jgi:hypothetical protein